MRPQWDIRIRKYQAQECERAFTGNYAECLKFLEIIDPLEISEIYIVRAAIV